MSPRDCWKSYEMQHDTKSLYKTPVLHRLKVDKSFVLYVTLASWTWALVNLVLCMTVAVKNPVIYTIVHIYTQCLVPSAMKRLYHHKGDFESVSSCKYSACAKNQPFLLPSLGMVFWRFFNLKILPGTTVLKFDLTVAWLVISVRLLSWTLLISERSSASEL